MRSLAEARERVLLALVSTRYVGGVYTVNAARYIRKLRVGSRGAAR